VATTDTASSSSLPAAVFFGIVGEASSADTAVFCCFDKFGRVFLLFTLPAVWLCERIDLAFNDLASLINSLSNNFASPEEIPVFAGAVSSSASAE
jgi:hypothetical protein